METQTIQTGKIVKERIIQIGKTDICDEDDENLLRYTLLMFEIPFHTITRGIVYLDTNGKMNMMSVNSMCKLLTDKLKLE